MKDNNGEYFDGEAVTIFEGVFSGAFDLPEEVGVKMKFNDVVVFMVSATVGQSTLKGTKSGDLKRANKLDIFDVKEIDSRAARAIELALAGSANSASSFQEQLL